MRLLGRAWPRSGRGLTAADGVWRSVEDRRSASGADVDAEAVRHRGGAPGGEQTGELDRWAERRDRKGTAWHSSKAETNKRVSLAVLMKSGTARIGITSGE